MVDVDTYRIATEDELVELGLAPWHERMDLIRALRCRGILVPVRGGSPDDPAAGGGDGDGDGKDGKDDGDGKDGGKDDDGATADLEAKLAKAAADKDRELRDLKRKQEDADRQKRESEGEFEKLYNDEKARADKLEKELEDFRTEVDTKERTNAAKAQAVAALKDAGVKNPERDVVHLDLSKIDSETAAKRAAKKFADDNPDLVDKSPRQKRGGGDGDDRDDDDEREGRDNNRGAVGPARLRRHFAGKGTS